VRLSSLIVLKLLLFKIMKRSLVCIVVLSCFCLVLCQNYIEPLSTSPAFFWANKNFLSGQNIQVNELTSMQDVKRAIIRTPSTLSKYLTANNDPEIIFVFVEPELTSTSFGDAAGTHESQVSGGKFANLKKLIESSTSSLVIQYVSQSKALSDLSLFDAIYMTEEELKNSLANPDWELKKNGATDIVVINFKSDDYLVHDKLFVTVDTSMKTSSYAAVLASGVDTVSTFEINHPVIAMLQATNNNTNNTTDNNMWPDGVVEALIIMIPFIIILFIGICCTFSVQSGLKFEGDKVKKQ